MNIHVQQILAMNKAGKITDQEAASLIEEVLRGESGPPPRSRWDSVRSDRGFAEPLASLLHTTINRVTEGMAGVASEGADAQGNVIQLSQFDLPAGQAGAFRGNRIRMSKVRDLRLERSEMTDNQIAASRMDEVSLNDARFAQNYVNASSIAELRIDCGEIKGLEIFSSKCGEFAVTGDSALRDLQVSATTLKGVRISDRTRWIDSAINASVLAEFEIRNSRLGDCEMRSARFRGTSVTDCDWSNVLFRGVTFDRSAFAGCRFNDVLFTGGESWDWGQKAAVKTRFEQCDLREALFSKCRFHQCVIRGVSLAGIKLQGADLRGQTLEGNEAFLRAVEGHRL